MNDLRFSLYRNQPRTKSDRLRSGINDFQIFGRTLSPGAFAPTVDITVADANYFQTIGQPLIAGRYFTDHDDGKTLPVAVINQTMARRNWPSGDPVGQRIAFSFKPDAWITIIGGSMTLASMAWQSR